MALGRKGIDCDFTQGKCDAFYTHAGKAITYDNNGAAFSMSQFGEAPTVESYDYILFGRVDVELHAAPGQGIITSVVLESLDLDEIDWEWVGNDNAQVQSNYFGKGDILTYDRGGFHSLDTPLSTVHTYSIDWTAERTHWIINGDVVRTLRYEEAKGGSRYPQTPMKVKLGTWVAGAPGAAPGTVSWAGGMADFSNGPSVALYKSVRVVDYAGGNGPTEDDVKEYVYGDMTGSWESIRIANGDGSSDVPGPSSSPKTSTALKTTTKDKETSVDAETTTVAAAATTTTSSQMSTTDNADGGDDSSTSRGSSTSTDNNNASSTSTRESPASNSPVGDAAPTSSSFGAAFVATLGLLLAQLV